METPEDLKVPPHSIEAEQSVLGGLLIDDQAWDRVADLISAEDFYRHDHRLIFEVAGQLTAQQQPVDIVTVSDLLERQGDLDTVGGAAYLASLANSTPTTANITHYARAVRERSILRALIQAAGEISEDAFRPGESSVSDILDLAEQRIFRIADQTKQRRSEFTPLRDLLREGVERLDELFQLDTPLTGLPTGFEDLDERTSGLQSADLIIVAGRPSMGKTAFVLNMAEHICVNSRAPVALFSLEMPSEQLTMRLLASRARIDAQRMRNGNLHDEDWPNLTKAVGELSEAPMFVDDTSALGPIELRARCRRLKRAHGLGLVIVDYLQLMHGAGTTENRTVEISEISRSLKALARELDVPVIALSQLSRRPEQRQEWPKMSDLRECVTGETPVVLSDGQRRPVRELLGTTPEVIAVTPQGRLRPAASNQVWRVGSRPVLALHLASGRWLRTSHGHQLLGENGWCRVDRLSLGDRVAVSPWPRPSQQAGEGGELLWDRVIRLESDGEEEVYDLSVPGPASWLADGIVSHNSGAIEQDADVVIFIHREEMYQPDNPEVQGRADLIIGKQRNGPTGVVHLTFLSKCARFENYAGPDWATGY